MGMGGGRGPAALAADMGIDPAAGALDRACRLFSRTAATPRRPYPQAGEPAGRHGSAPGRVDPL